MSSTSREAFGLLKEMRRTVLELNDYRDLRCKLKIRASCHAKELFLLAATVAPVAFCDVAGYRDNSPSHLAGDPEDLVLRKR